jgi:predicted phosphodiesterase
MKSLLPAAVALLLPPFLCAQTVLVKPYVQPGNGSTLEGTDVKVIEWVTDQTPGEFTVEFAVPGAPPRTAKPERVALDFQPPKPPPPKPAPAAKPGGPGAPTTPEKSATPAPPAKATPIPAAEIPVTLEDVQRDVIKEASPVLVEREQHYFKYAATLTELPFDTEVKYRVKLGATIVREEKFRTRTSAGKPVRFVMIGDLANGKSEQNGVAFQIAQTKPDFMVVLGDIVYSAGRVSQYMHHFWPTYNDVAAPSAKTGAPLMKSIPIYPVIGNHDADMAKLPETPDALAAFYFFSAPLNGPGVGPWNTPLGKDAKVAAKFRADAGASYPALSEYSFDYGPAHFLVLDTNGYNTPSFMKLAPWVEKDLKETKQPWKFVCMHAPAFHTSPQHYAEQKMRLLEPIFEANGVNVVFAGHVHNYQRSKPLHFTPNPPARDAKGRVNGDFQFDDQFDGVTSTTPNGIIHVVTGGGGATLYNAKDFEKTVAQLAKDNPGNYVPLTAKYVADKHSFSLIELNPSELVLRQISIEGKELDRIRITRK